MWLSIVALNYKSHLLFFAGFRWCSIICFTLQKLRYMWQTFLSIKYVARGTNFYQELKKSENYLFLLKNLIFSHPLKANISASGLRICVRVVMAIWSAFWLSPRVKFVRQHRIFLFVAKLIHVSMLGFEQGDIDYCECPFWETSTLDSSTTKVKILWKTQISFSIASCLNYDICDKHF